MNGEHLVATPAPTEDRNLPRLLREAERRVNAHVFRRGGDDALVSIPANPNRDVDLLLMEAAAEMERLQAIEILARELVTTGMSLRFSSGPTLSVIEKADRSDPHYRLCQALDLTSRRATHG